MSSTGVIIGKYLFQSINDEIYFKCEQWLFLPITHTEITNSQPARRHTVYSALPCNLNNELLSKLEAYTGFLAR